MEWFFFFQAEDGIRDSSVTGVQTCALPIFITDIALDHQNFLGNTVREIAGEKAGIIRPRGLVVTLPQHPEANDVIGNTILERDARGGSALPYVPPRSPGAEADWAERGTYPL